jgi:hypothetical protein
LQQSHYFSKPLPMSDATALLRFGTITRVHSEELEIANPV